MDLLKISSKKMILIVALLLIIIAIITVPNALLDATDVHDYADTAKFFAGEYAAKIRTTHSMAYGLLLSPYISLTHSFFFIRFSSVFFLLLIILSVYYVSGKNKKTLWLISLSPVIWYLAPWVSPVPLATLMFIWTYYFLKKFDKRENWKYVLYAGLLMGIASIFWDTVLYFSVIFFVAFLYDKKLYHLFIYSAGVLVGIIPRMIMDQVLFNFASYGILKNIFALLAFSLYGGQYHQGYSTGIVRIILLLIFIPFYTYLLFNKKDLLAHRKLVILLVLTTIFVLFNPQLRLIILITPFLILLLGEKLNDKQFRIQISMFTILSLLAVAPYVLQSKYELSDKYLEGIILNAKNFEISNQLSTKIVQQDLSDISRDYSNQTFVVGNLNDDYRILAYLYWGKGIKELISIEDYNLYLQNKTIIANKEIRSNATPNYRREIWIDIGIGKNLNDKTDYSSIKYAISTEDNLELSGFKFVKKYRSLSLYEKE